MSDAADALKLIAFYLPQFHPIPENDAWWGEGFTEWRNVANARPLFDGHYQPHLPSSLGFYDLRLPETREAQAELARAHGITGFCYYHYWFSGKQLLERPFEEVLASGRPDFPFCLCWANEPWSRRWDGQEQDVLQPQSYSEEDDRRHIAWLLPAFLDERAIRVDGKPLFLVYQGRELPDPARTVEIWQEAAREAGLPGIHLVSVETGWDEGWDASQVGFDGKVLFQPQFSILGRQPRLDVGPAAARVYDYQQAWRALADPPPVELPPIRMRLSLLGQHGAPRRGRMGSPQLAPGGVRGVAGASDSTDARAARVGSPRLPQRLERVGRRRLPRARPAVRACVPRSDQESVGARVRRSSSRVDEGASMTSVGTWEPRRAVVAA